MELTSDSRSSRQLEFISVSKGNEILVGASNLINSGDWNGDLLYFASEKELPVDEDVFVSQNCIKHYVSISICDGCFLDEKKVVVGNDCGMLAIYTVSEGEREDCDKLSFYNNVCSVEHDRGILSLSVSQDSKKIATGSMDRSIKLWDVEMFLPETTYTTAHAHYITSVRYKYESNKPDEGEKLSHHIFLSTSLDGYCLLWDSRQEHPAQVISKNKRDGYTTAEWFDSGDKVFLGCEDGTLTLSDIRSPGLENQQNYQFFNKYINKISSFHRNSEKFIAVSEDSRTVKVLQYKSDDSLEEIYSNKDHKDYVKGLVWMNEPDEEILLSCSWDSRVIKHNPFKKLNIGD